MINHFCAINMDESLRGGAGCLTEGKQVTIDEALCLRDLGDMTKAIALLENLVARQPQHFESLRLLGLLSAQLGRMDQAVEWICRAIEVEPQSATALIDLGRFMCSLGHTLGGGECFDKAALFCFDSESCFSLGSAFYEIGQWQKAFEHFERAIALKSDFVFAYNNRGLALGKLGLLDLALESFDKAIALEPKNAVLHNNRGVAFYDLDHDNLAVQS